MPLLKAKLQYSTLPIGESFCLVADDPAAGPDIERWATRWGRFSHSCSRPAQGRNQQSARRCDLIKVLRNWMDRYLSDEEAILFALLLIGFFALIIWLRTAAGASVHGCDSGLHHARWCRATHGVGHG